MNKIKTKIVLFLFLSAIGLIVGFFFAGCVNLLLTGGNLNDAAVLEPAILWESVMTDERHRLLTLGVCFVIVAGIAALLLTSRRETFESDTSAVAGELRTPVAVGQGQHGSARWMKPAERRRAFAPYRLSEREPVFAALLEAGARDGKDVENYDESDLGAGGAAVFHANSGTNHREALEKNE
ncbi:MAG: hypothetical protein LBP73_07180 [Clostridiales Family XIII bacterium]|nr:hypothetical protein [Clostridiales Family XIII bacterium]